MVVEQCLLTVKECFVYRVPPLKTASGHRAEEWGLETPLLTGHLKIFQADDKLRIVLYRYKDPTSFAVGDNLLPFAECPIQMTPHEVITPFVDAVIDSSRYFAIRIKDPANPNRFATLGIGFRERDAALDFKQVLNDYVRYVDRMAAAEVMAAAHEGRNSLDEAEQNATDTASNQGVGRDFSIKEGQKIHINVPKKYSAQQSHELPHAGSAVATGPASGLKTFLRPPPPPGSVVGGAVSVNTAASAMPATAPSADPLPDGEEWSDFS